MVYIIDKERCFFELLCKGRFDCCMGYLLREKQRNKKNRNLLMLFKMYGVKQFYFLMLIKFGFILKNDII